MENRYTHINKKLYYGTVLVVIVLMLVGLFVGNPLLPQLGPGYFAHIVLVIISSICLFIYPLYKSHTMRLIMMIVASTYIRCSSYILKHGQILFINVFFLPCPFCFLIQDFFIFLY